MSSPFRSDIEGAALLPLISPLLYIVSPRSDGIEALFSRGLEYFALPFFTPVRRECLVNFLPFFLTDLPPRRCASFLGAEAPGSPSPLCRRPSSLSQVPFSFTGPVSLFLVREEADESPPPQTDSLASLVIDAPL